MPANSADFVLWERGADFWTVHVQHSSAVPVSLAAGPWRVDVAQDQSGVSQVTVYDSSASQVWSRKDLHAEVGVEDGVALIALRRRTPERYWQVEGVTEGAVVVCDDGLKPPRIVGVALVGQAATPILASPSL